MDYNYGSFDEPSYYSANDELGLAFLGMFFMTMLVFLLAIYVVSSIFLMKLLKHAGHKTPASAWVPVWNTVSLMEIGGIRQPWIWTLILFGASFISGIVPILGFFVSLALLVASIILTVYLAKGVQAGVGKGSTGGIVLAVLLPVVWIIWMAVEAGKTTYNKEAAIHEGGRMPMNWFGESDVYAPFSMTAPVHSSYGPPPAGTPTSWSAGQSPDTQTTPVAPGYTAPPMNPYYSQEAPPAQKPNGDSSTPIADSQFATGTADRTVEPYEGSTSADGPLPEAELPERPDTQQSGPLQSDFRIPGDNESTPSESSTGSTIAPDGTASTAADAKPVGFNTPPAPSQPGSVDPADEDKRDTE